MYPFLRRGYHLPSVAAVQVLINRKMERGEHIAVDGIYGPNTESAVEDFQNRTPGLQVDGIVGENTWGELVSRTGLQVIDSVDVTDEALRQMEASDISGSGGRPLVNFGQSGGLRTALDKIRHRAGQGDVVLLRFHGHGSPGSMGTTSGRLGSSAAPAAGFGSATIDYAAQWLARKMGPSAFAPFGSVELHGCNVARGAQGRRLLTALAWALQVPATAGTRTQRGGGTASFRFEGPTRTVVPGGGSIKSWARSLPVAEAAGMSVHR